MNHEKSTHGQSFLAVIRFDPQEQKKKHARIQASNKEKKP